MIPRVYAYLRLCRPAIVYGGAVIHVRDEEIVACEAQREIPLPYRVVVFLHYRMHGARRRAVYPRGYGPRGSRVRRSGVGHEDAGSAAEGKAVPELAGGSDARGRPA